jgi:hypothetical protein
MAQKHGTGHFKAIKCHARILLTGVFLFFGLFLFSNSILAGSFPYDFEDPEYILGDINGQNGWTGSGSSTVSTASKYTGDQGLELYQANHVSSQAIWEADPDTGRVNAGEVSFFIKFPAPDSAFDFQLEIRGYNDNHALGDANLNLEFIYNAGNFNNFLPCSNNIYPNIWYNFKISWDSSISTSTYALDCGSGTYQWTGLVNPFKPGQVMGFSRSVFTAYYGGVGYGHGKAYIDAILSPFNPPAGDDLTALVLPAYPPANSTTTYSGGEVSLSGLYSYATSTDFTIMSLDAILTDKIDLTKRFIFGEGIFDENSGSYFISGGIPDGTYDLSWRFGYFDGDIDFNNYKFFYPEFDPATVIMGNSIYSATGTEIIYPAIPQEDCSILTGVESWLCNIKNFFSGIFYISPAKMTELNSSLDKMKNKFPYNYIEVDKNFFTDLKNGINSTSTISLTILNNNQTINFGAIQNSTGTVAGTTQNTGTVLKNLFSIIILAGFLAYAISFGRRIFK